MLVQVQSSGSVRTSRWACKPRPCCLLHLAALCGVRRHLSWMVAVLLALLTCCSTQKSGRAQG